MAAVGGDRLPDIIIGRVFELSDERILTTSASGGQCFASYWQACEFLTLVTTLPLRCFNLFLKAARLDPPKAGNKTTRLVQMTKRVALETRL